MATQNFSPSNLVKGQSKVMGRYMDGEWRTPDSAAISTAYTGQKANPFLAQQREREDRAVSMYMPIQSVDGTATERLARHIGTGQDSLEVPITWVGFSETFSLSIKQLDNNVLSFDEAWASSMKTKLNSLVNRVDPWFLAQLDADKTEINYGVVDGTFNTTNNIMEVGSDYSDWYYQNILTSMRNNLFGGEITVISDSKAAMRAARSVSQGQGNATNLGFQFEGMNIVQSTRQVLSDSANYNGSSYAFGTDLTGLVYWIPKQNRVPLDADKTSDYNGALGSMELPILDQDGNTKYTIPIAMSVYTDRADTSSRNGRKQDFLIEAELSFDVGYVSAPMSTIRATTDPSTGIDFSSKTDSVVYGFGQDKGGSQT